MKAKFFFFCVMVCVISNSSPALAAPGRQEMKLSGNGWGLLLDSEAEWVDDEIFVPPVDVLQLPVNPPSCGWEKFRKMNLSKVLRKIGSDGNEIPPREMANDIYQQTIKEHQPEPLADSVLKEMDIILAKAREQV